MLTTFLVAAPKTHTLTTKPSPTKNGKFDFLLYMGGALTCVGVHLQLFPINYAFSPIFSPPWGTRAPSAGYAYARLSALHTTGNIALRLSSLLDPHRQLKGCQQLL